MMCCPKFSSSRASLGQFLSCMLILAGVSEAQTNGTWIYNGGGNWTDHTKWSPTHASGAGAIANFSTINITGDRSINVNSPITIGALLLGDTDNNRGYKFQQNSITFDNNGTDAVLSSASGSTHHFDSTSIVLNDNLVVTQTSSSIELKSGISGSGGLYINSGKLQLRSIPDGANTYSGPTVLNNDAQVMFRNGGWNNESVNSNIIINGGIFNKYYDSNMTIPLGTGARQMQILGGTSGFSGNRNFNVSLNGSGQTVVWGSTFFNPDKLVLTSDWANIYGKTILNNRIDLNGADRTITILSNNDSGGGYGQVSNVISDSSGSGAGLIKEGLGVLYLAHNNTFTGGVEIKEGVVRVGHANALGTQTDGGLNFTGGGTKLDIRNNISLKSLASTEVYFGTITNGGATATTLTIDLSADSTYRGLVEDGYTGGTTSITKTGPATLTFGDAASYHSGETKINEGTFILDQDWDYAASTITVASGAVFGGDGLLGGDLTFADGAKFAFDPAKTLSVDAYNSFLGLNTDLGNLGLADLVLTNAASVDDGIYVLINGASTIDATDLQNYGSANAGSFEGKTAYFDLVDSDSDVDSSLDLVLVVGSVDPDTSTYTGWKASHGLEGASDDSDSDGDNIALIVEFALGGDPTAADMDILPTMKMTEDLGNTYLELMITRPVGLTGISYLPQTHTAMSGWPLDSTGIINANPTPLDNGDGTESVTYRRAQAISDSTKAFMRLQVQPSP